MGYPLYTCSGDFPERIPFILAELSPPAMSNFGENDDDELEGYFCLRVRRGRGKITIFGDREKGEMNVAIVLSPLNPLRWRANSKLFKEAKSALLAAGMKEIEFD